MDLKPLLLLGSAQRGDGPVRHPARGPRPWGGSHFRRAARAAGGV